MTAPEHVVAVDIDLRQFAAWSSRDGQLCAEASWLDFGRCLMNMAGMRAATMLLECASPHLYAPKGKVFKKQQAWVIYNSMHVSRLVDAFPKTLVAPSSRWTKGLTEPVRHKLAGVVEPVFPRAKGRHDLKDCQAMIWTYQNEPDLWVPLAQFLEEL